MQETVYAIDRESYNCGYEFDRAPGILENVAQTIKAVGGGAVCYARKKGEICKKQFATQKSDSSNGTKMISQ